MINVAVISASSAVIVPDLSGKTAAEVLATLTAAELTIGTASTTTSGANSSNTGKVATQTVPAGTRVERYSSVGYTTYFYESTPTPPTVTPTPTPVTCTPNGLGSYYAGQGVCSSGWAETYNCSDGSTQTVCVSAPAPAPGPTCTPSNVPLGGGCYYVTDANCNHSYDPPGCGSSPSPTPTVNPSPTPTVNPTPTPTVNPTPTPAPCACTPTSTYMGGGCYALTNCDCSHSTSCG